MSFSQYLSEVTTLIYINGSTSSTHCLSLIFILVPFDIHIFCLFMLPSPLKNGAGGILNLGLSVNE